LLTTHPRAHPEASDVWVTGTFDDWTKSTQLNKVGDHFEKTIELPLGKKVLYKVRDTTAPQASAHSLLTESLVCRR